MGEMKDAMEKVADEKATSDKEWRENIRHFEEEWHTTEIASREALMDEVVKKRREIKERNIALERRQWTSEQRERGAEGGKPNTGGKTTTPARTERRGKERRNLETTIPTKVDDDGETSP